MIKFFLLVKQILMSVNFNVPIVHYKNLIYLIKILFQ